jgi:dolichol-phosphate mannosyltransferase
VPVFNEEGNILPLTKEVQKALQTVSFDYELVFIDDGSTDSTWIQIAKARALEPRVRGIRHLKNAGQSAALWTGIQATTAPLIATLDGDLQNDPADLPKLLAELNRCDFVCGVRAKRNDSWVRRVSSRVARRARRAVLKVDFCDTGCAMRAFKRSALQGVFPFNGLHRFLPVLVHGAGAKATELPVNHRPRTAGVSKYGLNNRLWRGIADLFAIAWYQKRRVGPVPIQELPQSQEVPAAGTVVAASAGSPGPRTLPHSHNADQPSGADPGKNGSSSLEPSFA